MIQRQENQRPGNQRSGNRLKNAASPYLLQHADNPVDWYPWGEEALSRARSENKPLFISIGYAACHWCHVMAHESFEDPEIAERINADFIPIKIDREERPDIDQIYMAALHAMGEQGGWPLSIFARPDGSPFWGGTYFPPRAAFGRPSFTDVLTAVKRAWQTGDERLLSNAEALSGYLKKLAQPPETRAEPRIEMFGRFAARLLELQDTTNGGLSGAPKFPSAPHAEILYRAGGGNAAHPASAAFLNWLRHMAHGGIYDHLAGGLARYSVDAEWLVPHFEKMLYDNAHFIRHLIWAYRLTGDPLFRRRIEETADWLLAEMRVDGGGFAASFDADSEGEEGKYYVWSLAEIETTLGDGAPAFARYFAVTQSGNFEGNNILNRLHAVESGPPPRDIDEANARLLEARRKRVPPGRDDKVLTDWNGYAIRALAEAAAMLGRDDWHKAAEQAYRFVSKSKLDFPLLCHSQRGETLVYPAMATDYAAMSNAALTLFETTGKTDYLDHAAAWLSELAANYSDGHSGYYLTVSDPALIARPRSDSDEANPSGAAQIMEAMIRFSALADAPEKLQEAHLLAGNVLAKTAEAPYGTAGILNQIHQFFNAVTLSIHADEQRTAETYKEIGWRSPLPGLIMVNKGLTEPTCHLGKEMMVTAATPTTPFALICQQQSCSLPLTGQKELAEALRVKNTEAAK